jgi:hypothetical protein
VLPVRYELNVIYYIEKNEFYKYRKNFVSVFSICGARKFRDNISYVS